MTIVASATRQHRAPARRARPVDRRTPPIDQPASCERTQLWSLGRERVDGATTTEPRDSGRRSAPAPGCGATIERGAPRWTLISNRRRPQQTDPDAATIDGLRPSPEEPRGRAPPRPDSRPRLRRGQRLGRAVRDLQRLRPAHLRRPDDVHEPAVDHGPRRAAPPRRRRRDHRRAVRRRGEPPTGRPIRAARDPRGPVHVGLDQLAPARRRAVRRPQGGRCRRRQHRPGLDRAGPRDDLPQGPRGRRDRRHPDRARWRPLDHVAERDRHRRGAPPGEHRHRPFRCPRRHRQRRLGRARRPRHADAPPHRIGRRCRAQLRPGRAARLLAAGRDVRVDAGAGPALPLHDRDRGARRGGGRRPGHRGGPRRPRRDLPEPRHRRHRPGPRARHRHARARRHAHPRGAARDPPDRRRGRPRRHGHRRGVAAVRPRRDHGDGRQPGRARGHQRPRPPSPRRHGRPLGTRPPNERAASIR